MTGSSVDRYLDASFAHHNVLSSSSYIFTIMLVLSTRELFISTTFFVTFGVQGL